MGSSNRDYMQSDYDTGQPAWAHDVPTTKWLLIITVAVFFLQTMLTHEVRVPQNDGPFASSAVEGPFRAVSRVRVQPLAHDGFGDGLHISYVEEWCLLDPHKVLGGQVWRLVTYFFCHDRGYPFGLVFNMIGLWYLGSSLERMYGSRELLWFYLASGVVCGLIFTAFGLKMFLPAPMIGAGPCVMALLTLYATHFPRQEILFCWVIPIQIRVLLFIYIALDLYRILQASKGEAAWMTVAYLSELWGIGFGYCYRRFNWHLTRIAEIFDLSRLQRKLRRASTARTLKVFHPEPTSNLDEQVDAILAKIHEQGSESLTERERSILQTASERAKNRL